MSATQAVRAEYSAREFNRDPSAISRAAHALGSVRITNRGQTSLIVLDAARHPELAAPAAPRSLLESFTMATILDEDVIGEPPRLEVRLRTEDEA